MRILHIITTVSRLGGAENHLLSLIREQSARGHETDLVWLKGDGEIADRYRDAGCRTAVKVPFERPTHAFSAIASLRRRMTEHRYHIVHTHLIKSDVLGGIAARLTRPRPAVLTTKHCDEPVFRILPVGIAHGVLTRIADDHVISISARVQTFFERRGYVPKSRSSRVYYGFDRSLYPAGGPLDIRKQFSLPGESFVFGIVGRLTEQKNHLFLLPVFAELARVHPEARLMIIGGEGYSPDYRMQVEELIDSLGIGDRTIMTGWREDAYALMGGLDCMVLPSAWEGLGVVFIEAISQGVPVVATRTSAVPEVVRDGIDGILVEPGAADQLHDAMSAMIEQRDIIQPRTRREGPAYIDTRFSVDNMVEETFAAYSKALARRGIDA